MKKSALLLFALCAMGYAAPPAHAFNGCSLYRDANWRGEEFRLGRRFQQSFVGSAFNDQASSASVPAGCTMTLFQDINFGGASRTLGAGDQPNLGVFGFNDIVSSFRCSCGAGAMQTLTAR